MSNVSSTEYWYFQEGKLKSFCTPKSVLFTSISHVILSCIFSLKRQYEDTASVMASLSSLGTSPMCKAK